MLSIVTGRHLRMVRIRKDWRHVDVSEKSGLSRSVIGRHESGVIGSLAALERHAAVLGLRVELRMLGRGGELARLTDAEHAAIVELLAAWFRNNGFLVEVEASFSEWGERGRIDLLAFDRQTGMLVIVEVKTELLDMQDLFGGMDVKARLAGKVAERLGWVVRRRVSVLAVAATAANREMVRTHPTLFAAFGRKRLTVAALREGEPSCSTGSPHRRLREDRGLRLGGGCVRGGRMELHSGRRPPCRMERNARQVGLTRRSRPARGRFGA